MDVKSYPPATEFARKPPLLEGGDDSPPPWAPSRPAMSGGKVFLCVLLTLGIIAAGAWAVAVAYGGPAYGFAIDGAPAWQQTMHRIELHLVPGAVAAVAGLLLLIILPALHKGKGRFWGTIAAFLIIAAGLVLVLGRAGLAAYSGSQSVDAVSGSPYHVFVLRLGYEWGPGLILVWFAAWHLGLQAVGKRRDRSES